MFVVDPSLFSSHEDRTRCWNFFAFGAQAHRRRRKRSSRARAWRPRSARGSLSSARTRRRAHSPQPPTRTTAAQPPPPPRLRGVLRRGESCTLVLIFVRVHVRRGRVCARPFYCSQYCVLHLWLWQSRCRAVLIDLLVLLPCRPPPRRCLPDGEHTRRWRHILLDAGAGCHEARTSILTFATRPKEAQCTLYELHSFSTFTISFFTCIILAFRFCAYKLIRLYHTEFCCRMSHSSLYLQYCISANQNFVPRYGS